MYTSLVFGVLVLEAHVPCPSPTKHATSSHYKVAFVHQKIHKKSFDIEGSFI